MSNGTLIGAVAGTVLVSGAVLIFPVQAADMAIPLFAPSSNVGWVAQGGEFLPPNSGPGPVMNDPAHPRISNAVAAATGQQPTFHIGDASSPILQPWAAERVKQWGERVLSGKPGYTRQAGCWPNGVPAFLLYPVQPIFIWQSAKQVLMVSQEDHQVRHVYMNVPHSEHVPLSWHGESVGHYEADMLVVDTIGLNDQVYIDNYRTPHTDKLHIVERFHMTDGGKTLEVDLHVEDPGAFTTAWNAIQRYRRVEAAPIGESFCAEGNFNYFNLDVEAIPQAKTPDF
jgi:hypothetical protein